MNPANASATAAPPSPGGSAKDQSSDRRRLPAFRLGGISRFTGLGLWAVFIAVFALWIPDTFLTSATAKSIASDQAVTAILAVGLLFTLAAGCYDLSIASNLGLSAVVAASLMVKSGVAPLPAVLITLAMGAGIGALNGIVVAGIGVNSFIATLGMGSVLTAFTSLISHDQFVGPLPQSFQEVAKHQPLGIPIMLIYALFLAVLAWYALEHSPLGRRAYATGANSDAARLAGVRTGRYVFGTFILTGIFASLAGALLAAKVGSVSSEAGPSYLLPAFAACFLGTTQIKIGRFNVWGTIIALYLLATGVKGLQLAGLELWVTDLFNGVALIGAVSLAVISEKRRGARIKRRTARSQSAEEGTVPSG
jgi:ribose transport system permease protein